MRQMNASILIGCKFQAFADNLQIPFYEVSAKSAVGIEEMFKTAARKCIDQSKLAMSSPAKQAPSGSSSTGAGTSSNTAATASAAATKVRRTQLVMIDH